jgi:hypothetical protein
MITMAEPTAEGLIDAIVDCVAKKKATTDAMSMHARIADAYDWNSVAQQTLVVYREACQTPPTHYQVLHEYQKRCGVVFGKVFCLLFLLDMVFLFVFQCVNPDCEIEEAPAFKCRRVNKE